jgi:outer membrane murein-binding lipoprotein Lpp
MGNGDGITNVRFSLWAVLASVVALLVFSVGFLNATDNEIRTKQQEINQRVTRLETQYDFIAKGIERLIRIADESNSTAVEIRNDQIRRQKKEKENK